MKIRLILAQIFFSLTLLAFTVYSYSQIDLNLTLSSNQTYQAFQKAMIQLGYFNRPLSAYIYIVLLIAITLFYVGFLYSGKRISMSFVKLLIFISIVIQFISYPAFSHDIFNYMFDARIVTKYHSNPYNHAALDYPQDPWTRFMHWTHRTYPYGPLWLVISIVPSILGFGRFILTLLNFKIIFSLFHIGNIYLIHKILNKIDPKREKSGIIFYSLNPLIIIESLTSPHNEVMMLFFLLAGIYYSLVKKSIILSVISFLISGGIKFVTLILLPFVFIDKLFHKKVNFDLKIMGIFLLLIPVLLLEIYTREPYPWYLILFIGIGALITQFRLISISLIGFSIGTILRYAPYLFWGDYGKTVIIWQNSLFWLAIISSMIFIILTFKNVIIKH